MTLSTSCAHASLSDPGFQSTSLQDAIAEVYEELRRDATLIASEVNVYLSDKDNMRSLSRRNNDDAQRLLDILDSVINVRSLGTI